MTEDKAIFIETVRADDSLPPSVREQARAVEGLERSTLDPSYLDFLREQIALEARGPEWTAVLTKRFTAIAPYCGLQIIFGAIRTPTGFYFVRVDPDNRRVIYHEEP